MGDKKGMDKGNNKEIIVYANLDSKLIDKLFREGEIYSRREYVEKKYKEAKDIFISVYSWFNENAGKYIKRGTLDYPYWIYMDISQIDGASKSNIIKLQVPKDEIIIYRFLDWMAILRFDYLSDDKRERESFYDEMKKMGIKNINEVVLTPFYPLLKNKLLKSWENLFKLQEAFMEDPRSILKENFSGAVFKIKREWIIEDK